MPYYKRNRPTIGVLAGWQVYTGTPDSFLGNVFRGIQVAAHDRNCNLLMACGIDSGRPAWPLLSSEVAFAPVGPWNTDGLIFVSPFASAAGSRYTQDLIASGFPAIYAGDRDAGPGVVADSAGGIRQALAHLVEHGHRQIAFVAGRLDSEHGDSGERLRAFEAGLDALSLPFNPKLVAYGSHNFEGGRQAIQQIIGRGEKFTAVLASNDRSAMGVLEGLRQAGIGVPQDVALVGFDDRLEARALVPSLTTVHYPMFGLGYQAVELLLRAIEGEAVIDELVHIPTRLVIRESCGCLPGIPANEHLKLYSTQLYPTQQELYSTQLYPTQPPPTRQQLIAQLTLVMTAAVHNESLWLSQAEVADLSQRLVESFMASLEHSDPLSFHLVVKQMLERVSTRGDDLFAWQTAVTILRNQLPAIRQAVFSSKAASAAPRLTNAQEEEMLHQVRVAISEAARGRATRTLLQQANNADQVGLLTSKFFAALDEREIFDILESNLPAVGIPRAEVGYYLSESDDPVAWCTLPQRNPGPPSPNAGERTLFPTRQFPPEGLYSPEQPYQLAILPLKIQGVEPQRAVLNSLMAPAAAAKITTGEICGFVAFDATNLEPCADIVRQLGAALWGVRMYREAVEARQQAEEGKRLAEEANRLKSRFLSMVSHELRTPLNLITGLSNMLLDHGGVEPQHLAAHAAPGVVEPQRVVPNSDRQDLQRIYLSAQHLDGLIRDVLDLASSDVGQLKLACEPLDMTEVLQTVAAIGEQLAHDKGLAWQCEIAPRLPRVWGDRTRLRQVTLNLVSNAVKFTTHGEVILTALVEKSMEFSGDRKPFTPGVEYNSRIKVSVKDTGLGIPQNEQSVIFEEFRQSERTTARGYGGLGLGLAICRKLVEMHGGEIGACSSGAEGEGSLFYFTLPVMDPPETLSARNRQETIQQAPNQVLSLSTAQKILLLVKNEKAGSFLQKDLVRRGFEAELILMEAEPVSPATGGWLASLLLAAPDVVILDLSLTSERGWEILKIMKENPFLKDIPVLFYAIAEDAGGTEKRESEEHGDKEHRGDIEHRSDREADGEEEQRGAYGSLLEMDYLTKPIGSTALSEILAAKGFLGREQVQGEPNRSEAGKPILVVDDEPGMRELYARLIEAQLPGRRVLMAKDGLQALKMINEELPALVLLDLMMPEMDGFDVLEGMRKSELTRNIPVVVITGQVLTGEDMARLNSGVASVLGKGMFSVEETLQHLADALARKRKPGSETQRIALKAMAYIHQNYTEPISRSDVAAHVGLSERHLTRIFHQEVGMTLVTYLNRYRVRQAKALLDSGAKGITEIAIEVGFSSSTYFNRIFREEVGVSPRAYLHSISDCR